jgi:hypothetical protein
VWPVNTPTAKLSSYILSGSIPCPKSIQWMHKRRAERCLSSECFICQITVGFHLDSVWAVYSKKWLKILL